MDVTSMQASDLLNMAGAEKLKDAKENGKLKKACADFESVLLNYMFQSMKKTVGEGGIFGDSFQRNMYESLYIEKISEKISEERDLGLGNTLYRQLTAQMEKDNGEKGNKTAESHGEDT